MCIHRTSTFLSQHTGDNVRWMCIHRTSTPGQTRVRRLSDLPLLSSGQRHTHTHTHTQTHTHLLSISLSKRTHTHTLSLTTPRGQCEVDVYTPDEYPGQTRVRRLSDLLLLSSGGTTNTNKQTLTHTQQTSKHSHTPSLSLKARVHGDDL